MFSFTTISVLCRNIYSTAASLLLPRTRMEHCIVFGSLLAYCALGLVMSFSHDAFFYNEVLDYDTCYYIDFCFSSEYFFKLRLRHPLFGPLCLPVTLLFDGIAFVAGITAKRIAIILFYNVIAACSNLVIYKYARNLLALAQHEAALIVLFYTSMAHVLLLSFLPETFPIAALILLIFIYRVTESLQNNKPFTASEFIFFYILSAGVTLTNGLKIAVDYLLTTTDKLRGQLRHIVGATVLLLFMIVLMLGGALFSYQVFLKKDLRYIKTIAIQSIGFDYFDDREQDGFRRQIQSNLFAEPLLMRAPDALCQIAARAETVDTTNTPKDQHPLFNSFRRNYSAENYSIGTTAQILLGLIYALLLLPLILSYKRKDARRYLLLLVLPFAVDLFIHGLLRFGLSCAYLFALHWLPLFALLMAWNFRLIRHPIARYTFTTGLLIITVMMLAHNLTSIHALNTILSTVP